MAKIKRVNVLSLGKLLAVINAALGLVMGSLVTVGSLTGVDMTQGQVPADSLIQKFSILYFPVLYAIAGFLGGVLTALAFNLAAKYLGGLEIDIES